MRWVRTKNWFLVGGITGLGFIAVLGVLLAKTVFRVWEIRIHGNSRFVSDTLLLQQHYNLFLVNTETLSLQFAQKNPLLRNVQIEKHYPNRLDIFFETRKAIARIRFPQGEDVYLDEDAVVLPHGNDVPLLPVLHISSLDLIDNDRVANHSIKKSILIIRKLMEQGMTVDSLTIRDDIQEIEVVIGNEKLVMLSSIDIEFFSSSLQLLLRQFRIEGKQPKEIDFRFNKPIVHF